MNRVPNKRTPTAGETALAGGIVALLIAAGLAIKGAALMFATDIAADYVDVLEPVGFLPSVGLVLLFAILTAGVDFRN